MRPLNILAETLGIQFTDLDILRQALVHRSSQNESPTVGESYERLEFLGDSVLGFIVTEDLFLRFPGRSEGELTILRSAVVRTETLAKASQRLEVGGWIVMGRGEAAAGGRERHPILAGVFEAIIGAIFLDQGLDAARQFVMRVLADELADASIGPIKDHKSRLQEFTQANWQMTPAYTTVRDTDTQTVKFVSTARLGNDVLGIGEGRSKQQAEQAAARASLVRLIGEPTGQNA